MNDKERLKYIDEFDIRRICVKEPLRAVAIMTLIADELGSVTMSEFAEIECMNKRTVERQCKSGKIYCDDYFKRPLINIYIKQKNHSK